MTRNWEGNWEGDQLIYAIIAHMFCFGEGGGAVGGDGRRVFYGRPASRPLGRCRGYSCIIILVRFDKAATYLMKCLVWLLLIAGLAACAGSSETSRLTPTPQPSATALPKATQTPFPTVIPTATPILPSVDHNLSAVNADEMVLEGDVWVVKNGAGEVTARWDESAQAWTYEGEAIQMQIALVGFPNENIQLPPEMTQFMPDDSLKHLNNNGVPIPDGTIVDWDIKRLGHEGRYEQPTAYTAVRIRGVFQEGLAGVNRVDRYLMVFEIRLSPDQSLMVLRAVFDSGQGIVSLRTLPGGDISFLDLDPFSETFSPVEGLSGPEIVEYIDAMVGNQILLGIRYNIPDWDPSSRNNEQLQQLLAAIRSGEMPSHSVLDGLDWTGIYGDDLVVRE